MMRNVLCAGVMAATVLMTGCSGGTDGERPSVAVPAPPSTSVAATSSAGPADDWTVAAELGSLPASALPDGSALIVVGNLTEASQYAGVERPPAGADADALLTWAMAVNGPDDDATVAALLPDAVQADYLSGVADFRSELGWDLSDVDTFAEIQAPPARFSVLTGSMDDADLTAAMGEPVDGMWSVGPTEDGDQNLGERTTARPLGEGLRIGSAGGVVAVSRATDPVRDWVAGNAATLGEDPVLSALAGSLDARQVYSAMVVPDTSDGGGTGTGAALSPFTAMATGLAVVDGEAVLVLSYYYASPDAAQADVATLEQLVAVGTSDANGRPWSDRLTVRDVGADGNVLTGTFTIEGSPDIAWRLPAQRDNLASHR